MTNVEGLWMLFVLLFLLAACLAVTVLVAGLLGWRRWGSPGRWSDRLGRWSAVLGIGLSILSWAVAILLVTPTGIVANVADLNPVMIGMSVGYTLPAVAGYLLRARRGTHPGSVAQSR